MDNDTLFDLVLTVIACASLGVGIWNTVKIKEVHMVMNSRLDQLLKISTTAAYAAGVESCRLHQENEEEHKDKKES